MAVKVNELSGDFVPEELMEVLWSLASGWGDMIDDHKVLEVIPLKGAMTNEVFQISWPANTGNARRTVLVRVYGEGVENFFSRDEEIRTFEFMSKHKLGPRLLGQFPNGRVEEFIHGRTLSARDLRDPELSAFIAAKLREFHNLDVPGGQKNVFIWDRLSTWLVEAKSLCSSEVAKEFCLDDLEDEICVLEKELSQDHQDFIGFCHNDLQYGNIMYKEETKSITFIDYEYSSYNPVAYDFANHFCEMAADYHSETPHILDYSKYPDLEERQLFVGAYLSSGGDQPSKTEVDQFVAVAEKYVLVSHLCWGLWGLISDCVNNIEFDYREYARQRFEQYWLRKPSLLGSSADCHKTTSISL